MRDLTMGGRDGLPDGARIDGIPDDAVDVQIEGIPKVVVHVGQLQGGFAASEAFRVLLLDGARSIIDLLRPYDRRG